MNARELLRRVCLGHLMLVGEVRSADVREAGLVDTKTGFKSTIWLITYFVELMREKGFEMAKITQRMPIETPDLNGASINVEKGKCYAFEISSAERKHGFLLARMSTAAPVLIDTDADALPTDAPQGASVGGASP